MSTSDDEHTSAAQTQVGSELTHKPSSNDTAQEDEEPPDIDAVWELWLKDYARDPNNPFARQNLQLLELREKDPKYFDEMVLGKDDAACPAKFQSAAQSTGPLTSQPHPAPRSPPRPTSAQMPSGIRAVTPSVTRPNPLRESTIPPATTTLESGASSIALARRNPRVAISSQAAVPGVTRDDTDTWLTLPTMADERVVIPVDEPHSGEAVSYELLWYHFPRQQVEGPKSLVDKYRDMWLVEHQNESCEPARTVLDPFSGLRYFLSDDQLTERSRRATSNTSTIR